EAVDRTTRLHQQIAANAPFVAQLIRTEELQAVTTIVRKVAIGTDHQLGIVEVLRGAGIGLTDVRLHAAFGVALALRVGVRTLQEQPVPVALEEELQRAVGALRLRTHLERARGDVELVAFLPDLVRTDGNGLDRAVAIDVQFPHAIGARVVEAAVRERRIADRGVVTVVVRPLVDRADVAHVVDGALQVAVDATNAERGVVGELLLEAQDVFVLVHRLQVGRSDGIRILQVASLAVGIVRPVAGVLDLVDRHAGVAIDVVEQDVRVLVDRGTRAADRDVRGQRQRITAGVTEHLEGRVTEYVPGEAEARRELVLDLDVGLADAILVLEHIPANATVQHEVVGDVP